ncbi:hypothetical protein C8Q70DRAFT_750728 [Cubamyces menziesii]|nr:hypothetical protein C8Q70DRAFT_750728 [Cubamyces menziesii]
MLRGKGRWLTKRDETTPLLNDNKSQSYGQNDVEVTPMHHGLDDLGKATDTAYRAFLNDSIIVYFSSVDTRPFREARNKARCYLLFDDAIHKRRMLTVNKGDAVMRYGTPGECKALNPWRTFLEADSKIEAMLKDAFGEKVKEMYEVRTLATAPEAQGRGYGSALVNIVTEMGDADGHD